MVVPLSPLLSPEGITSTHIDCTPSCGLNFHILTAGTPGQPLLLLCHGYPELAFSWRKIMLPLAQQGYYVVAPDQRGYGRTVNSPKLATDSWADADLNDYTMTNLVRDLVCLVWALGYTEVASVIGHDFGGVSSAMCALIRPDVFRSCVQMSHPYHAPPSPAFNVAETRGEGEKKADVHAELANLERPRRHYKWYNSSSRAAGDWYAPPQGLQMYLRGYFHVKSADWERNEPHKLEGWKGSELAKMPKYYIMDAEATFPETITALMKGEDETKTRSWLSEADLQFYVSEWQRTGFQRALNWYRAQTQSTPQSARDMLLYAGAKISVPCAFVSGKQDWGNYQQPGAIESYDDPEVVTKGCFKGRTLIDGAGHWVQQERPEEVIEALKAFLGSL